MKYERTIKTLEKAGFVVVRNIRPSFREGAKPGDTYEEGFTAQIPDAPRVVEAHKQSDIVTCMRVRRLSDLDDSQSDYTAGSWVETVKRAIALATPTAEQIDEERLRVERAEAAKREAKEESGRLFIGHLLLGNFNRPNRPRI